MKRTFEIEWPDDNGPLWMNTSNLLLCLTGTCRNSVFTVRDVTGDGEACEEPETAGPANLARYENLKREITEAVARGAWCSRPNGHKVSKMDCDLAQAIFDEVFRAVRRAT